ncbi:DsbA family protein [Enterobacter cloacae complex sp. P40RS]|uniref:Thiol:disulfide interchange protein n=1 Tax=Enterobacter pasteurii TaxID=3029761 RepID=A0ABR9Q705_9ENTR|nr:MULTISPECIES: DsbA family protein [Enterobacter cloacae complex]MBE4854618.1 DsbA family protein [Enterobacter pasteurii]MBE4862904.1 DsbA family protein [Enterobacter cloacae complex sp. P40C2]MBE4876608.1 DsbA family protein [Enterobacter cloacae complex sp. P40C]
MVSALITVLYYHIFVFSSFAKDDSQTQAFQEVSSEQLAKSPIKEPYGIIEVMSYGCHYCAANEDNLTEFSRALPQGSTFTAIHIAGDNNGLAVWAPVFATLEAMGVEKTVRESAYNAIITKNIDLTNEKNLDAWLVKNHIDVSKFKKLRYSKAVKDRLNEMTAITEHYNISATPMFIINKRYVVAQDSEFPTFAQRMLKLLKEDK